MYYVRFDRFAGFRFVRFVRFVNFRELKENYDIKKELKHRKQKRNLPLDPVAWLTSKPEPGWSWASSRFQYLDPNKVKSRS